MSAQEIRNEIIQENLPKLIKQLTGFKDDDDENIRHCEHFAWSIIRNHRNLSTNSHEVKRKIEGIQEKFAVDNCQQYADHLCLLCDEIIKHPLCLEHYEVDVHWSLLDFLLALTYNPTGALKRNKHKIDLKCKQIALEAEQGETSYYKQLLKEDFIPLAPYISSDSDLSDWSDDSSSGEIDEISVPACDKQSARPAVPTKLQNLQPPAKQKHYKIFDSNKSHVHLLQNVQNTWWLPYAKHFQTPVPSDRVEANFSRLYSNFLMETSNNLIRFTEPSTASELCLMRELLWMFHSPQSCKFFDTKSTSGVIVRANVSIPSISVNGLSSFLEHNFLPYINMMSTLSSFLDLIYADFNVPKTLECYAANLRYLLTPIWQQFLDYESRLLAQNDFEISSILHMQLVLKKPLSLLETIYDIHSQAVLPFNQYHAHIASTYLLASLMHSNATATCAAEANLAISLFLTSIKIFCIIIDTWWTEGRLDDWQQEFLVESISTETSDQKIYVRQFSKNKEISFFVPTAISKMITENNCFRLLLEHSLEAGCTLNLLYEINRIADLKNACEVIEGKLFSVFLDEVMKHIKKLQSQVIPESESIHADVTVVDTDEYTSIEPNPTQDILNSLTTTDEFLLTAFACNINPIKEVNLKKEDNTNEMNAYDIWKELQKTGSTVLPLEEVVLTSLTRILKARIAFANNFVMKLYREEFVILKHLGNIRKVLLLEASDLMYQFYAKLFKSIGSGRSWANPFLLTMQLDDIICAKFPEMSSLFRLEISSPFRCQTNMVAEAVDEITVTYNFSRELSLIISQGDIQEYNKVFRFLLKVKWGLMTLESLRYPRCYKRRIPYAKFEMVDLLMRRLEQLRFWMIYAIQSVHFHLMTHVLQSMGEQLDEKIRNCTNLKEMEMVHRSYINTVCKHCFLADNYHQIKLGVEQLLNLTFILHLEWNSCISHIENNSPLAVYFSDSNIEDSENDYPAINQVDAIELTYIRCHQYLANRLNNEVYLKQKTFLSGLSAAFNTSLPY